MRSPLLWSPYKPGIAFVYITYKRAPHTSDRYEEGRGLYQEPIRSALDPRKASEAQLQQAQAMQMAKQAASSLSGPAMTGRAVGWVAVKELSRNLVEVTIVCIYTAASGKFVALQFLGYQE